jgi:thiol:disulfide interchange protein DsbC
MIKNQGIDMLKKLVGVALLGVMLSGMATLAFADEASVKKAVEAAYPKFKVDKVTKTPFSGLYEVFMGGQILYTDEKMNYIIADGVLVDIKTKQNLTQERMAELTKIDFKSLPLEQAIKVVKGDGSRKLVVFSDVDCPYCKKLERNELSQINNVTIYTFLFPIVQLHPDSAAKSKSIWCAKDRVKAWDDWIMHDILPTTTGACEVPLEKIGVLANKVGANSTPTLFFADGKRMLGAQPFAEIEKGLIAASAKK